MFTSYMKKSMLGRYRTLQLLRVAVLLVAGSVSTLALAEFERRFPLAANDQDLVGENAVVTTTVEDTLVDVAARHLLGYNMLRAANPEVDAWLPGEGVEVVLPMRSILPAGPRAGIVVNVPEMRLYYYGAGAGGEQNDVTVYPVSVGRGDWATPLIETRVTSRVKDPDWYPPKSIRAEHAARGDFLPAKVPAGPDNPLGQYLLVLGIPSYFIHGTNKKFGIGMQVTHGCIRMYPQDVEELARKTPISTPVTIINQPIKTGWDNGQLYVEVHQPLERAGQPEVNSRSAVIKALVAATRGFPETEIDWELVNEVAAAASGIPVRVGLLPPAVTRRGD